MLSCKLGGNVRTSSSRVKQDRNYNSLYQKYTIHHVGSVLGVLRGHVVETTMDSPCNVLVRSSRCSSLSRLGQSMQCAILDGALSDLVTGWATTEAGEGHATCGGRHSCPPRASSLSGTTQSGMTLSGAVIVGGVGTTSTTRSGHSPLGVARMGQRKHMSTWPLWGQATRGTLKPALFLLMEGVRLQTIPFHL
jgi:hypothetical protein